MAPCSSAVSTKNSTSRIGIRMKTPSFLRIPSIPRFSWT